MLKQLKTNKQGIVLVTILMIIIVMMVLAISVIGMNVSQVTITEKEVKRIQSEMLAKGALALTFANQASSSAGDSIIFTETLGLTTFTINTTLGSESGGLKPLNILVSF